jgi:hypothetical protein
MTKLNAAVCQPPNKQMQRARTDHKCVLEFPGFGGDMKTMFSTTLGDANVEPKERWEGPQDVPVH